MNIYTVTLTGTTNGTSTPTEELIYTVNGTDILDAQEVAVSYANADNLDNIHIKEISQQENSYAPYSNSVSPTCNDNTTEAVDHVDNSMNYTAYTAYTSNKIVKPTFDKIKKINDKLKFSGISYHPATSNGYYPFYTYRVQLPKGYNI